MYRCQSERKCARWVSTSRKTAPRQIWQEGDVDDVVDIVAAVVVDSNSDSDFLGSSVPQTASRGVSVSNNDFGNANALQIFVCIFAVVGPGKR